MKNKLLWKRYYVFAILCIISTVIVISYVFVSRFYSEEVGVVSRNSSELAYFVDSNINERINRIEEYVGGMFIAKTIYDEEDTVHKKMNQSAVRNLISTMCADHDEILAIFFVDKYGFNYSAGENLYSVENRLQMMQEARNSEEYKKNKQAWFFGKTAAKSDCCILYRDIVYVTGSYTTYPLGQMLVYVNSRDVFEHYLKDTNNIGLFFVDGNNKIVASSEKDYLGISVDDCFEFKNNTLKDQNNVSYVYQETKSQVGSWKCISYFKKSLVIKNLVSTLWIILIIMIMFIAVSIVLVYYISKYLGEPLEELLSYIKVSTSGEISVENNWESDEINIIKNSFEGIIEKLKRQIEISYQQEIELKNMLIKSYETQMNPHFLFNTLSMIQMLSILGKNENVPDMLRKLSNLLRFNLTEKKEVTIGEEIENIENYFSILKARYGDSFEYNILVNEDLYKYRTIKFVIQPFIENSIQHGLKDKKGQWQITIMIEKINNELAIIIRDNGIGISDSKLETIKRALSGDERNDKAFVKMGIGMTNVNNRIKLTYGEKYGVDVFSDKGSTQVIVHIPCQSYDEENIESV